MNLKLFFIIVVIIALVTAGIWYWLNRPEPVKTTGEAIEGVSESPLADIGTESNPGKKLPDVNPVPQTNPFKDVYQNPFAP